MLEYAYTSIASGATPIESADRAPDRMNSVQEHKYVFHI
jgi:hypothetical protein